MRDEGVEERTCESRMWSGVGVCLLASVLRLRALGFKSQLCLPLTTCVPSVNLLNLSVSQFPHLHKQDGDSCISLFWD